MNEETEKILKLHYSERDFERFKKNNRCLKCKKIQPLDENKDRDEKWKNTGLCTTCQIKQEPTDFNKTALPIEELDNILNVFLNDNGVKNGFTVVKNWDAPNNFLGREEGNISMRKISFKSPHLITVSLSHPIQDAHEFISISIDVSRFLKKNERNEKVDLSLFMSNSQKLRNTIDLCIRLENLIKRAGNK